MNALQNKAHWLLRIALASVFLFHGIGKVANFSGFVDMMGLPVPGSRPGYLRRSGRRSRHHRR